MENKTDVTKIITDIVVEVTDEDIDDIMASALEGGINYWCSKARVEGEYLGEFASDQISRGGELKLYDWEEEAVHTLTKEKFIEGLRLYLKDEEAAACVYIENGNAGVDPGLIDGPAADCIIQYAIFGELVYG